MLISPVKTSMSTSKETKEIKETRAEERARKQFEKDRAKVGPYPPYMRILISDTDVVTGRQGGR